MSCNALRVTYVMRGKNKELTCYIRVSPIHSILIFVYKKNLFRILGGVFWWNYETWSAYTKIRCTCVLRTIILMVRMHVQSIFMWNCKRTRHVSHIIDGIVLNQKFIVYCDELLQRIFLLKCHIHHILNINYYLVIVHLGHSFCIRHHMGEALSSHSVF